MATVHKLVVYSIFPDDREGDGLSVQLSRVAMDRTNEPCTMVEICAEDDQGDCKRIVFRKQMTLALADALRDLAETF